MERTPIHLVLFASLQFTQISEDKGTFIKTKLQEKYVLPSQTLQSAVLIEIYWMLIGRNNQIHSSDWLILLWATSGMNSNTAREVTQLEKKVASPFQFSSFREHSFDIQICERHKGMSR